MTDKHTVDASRLVPEARALVEAGWIYPVLHTAIDHGDTLELIYILRNPEAPAADGDRWLSCTVAGDEPVVDSLTPLLPGLIFQEREVYDLFGVTYRGHPDLRRLLLPEGFVGHPLRKSYQAVEGDIVEPAAGPDGGPGA